jgi:general secretion pathway protein K
MMRQTGAALLAAMLTVALVATLAVGTLWQQWRGVEVESAERLRMQSRWVLIGALDWARQILREDARQSAADSFSEPWAVPLREARLSTFLSADQDNAPPTDDSQELFLSGDIIDLQSRLNVTNLIQAGKIDQNSFSAFSRLFRVLGLPQTALTQMMNGLRLVHDTSAAAQAGTAVPLPPRDLDQLAWLGLSPLVIERLRPYVTLLPVPTPVNLNTAPAEVIYAVVNNFELADARRFVSGRNLQPLNTLADAETLGRIGGAKLRTTQLSVATRFFEVRTSLRRNQSTVQEIAVLQRDGLVVKTLSRRRDSTLLPVPQPQAS